MRILFSASLSVFLLVACNGNETTPGNNLLAQPPYGKLTDSLREHPQDAGLHYRRGALLYSNNQLKAAEEDLRAAWELQPQESHALGLMKVLRIKNADSAIAFLEGAVKKLPDNIPLHIELSRGYLYKKQTAQALAVCNEILARYPSDPSLLQLKSELLEDNGQEATSLAVLEKAYAQSPGDADLAHTLAYNYAEAKNPKVLRLADSLIRADVEKRHPEPYYFKGLYYSNTGKPEEAIRQFDKAIQNDFKFTNAYINKGIIYFDQKKYDQALKVFTLISKVSPTEPDPYRWLGKTQEALGFKEEAQHNYSLADGLEKQRQ